MLASEVDFGSYVTVAGYEGIAFWIDDWAKTLRDEYFEYYDQESGEVFWGWHEVEAESDSIVECYMVGDDRKFEIDIEDLTSINVNDFCQSCGQIGCEHG